MAFAADSSSFSISTANMGAVHVLDNYYLFITFLITIVYFYRIRVVNSTSSPILPAEQTLYFLRSSLRPSAAALVMLTTSLHHCLSWSGAPALGVSSFSDSGGRGR